MTLDELTEWPTETGVYKVVQLEIDNTPVLVFGEGNDHHGMIAIRYLRTKNIQFEKISRDIPHSEGENYRIVGAGAASCWRKQLKFWERSRDFDMGIDKAHIERLNELTDRTLMMRYD